MQCPAFAHQLQSGNRSWHVDEQTPQLLGQIRRTKSGSLSHRPSSFHLLHIGVRSSQGTVQMPQETGHSCNIP